MVLELDRLGSMPLCHLICLSLSPLTDNMGIITGCHPGTQLTLCLCPAGRQGHVFVHHVLLRRGHEELLCQEGGASPGSTPLPARSSTGTGVRSAGLGLMEECAESEVPSAGRS